MNYIVETVGDDELPAGINAVIVERDGEPPVLLINGALARVWTMMRAYEDTLEPPNVATRLMPLRLVSNLGIPVDGVSGWQALSRGAR